MQAQPLRLALLCLRAPGRRAPLLQAPLRVQRRRRVRHRQGSDKRPGLARQRRQRAVGLALAQHVAEQSHKLEAMLSHLAYDAAQGHARFKQRRARWAACLAKLCKRQAQAATGRSPPTSAWRCCLSNTRVWQEKRYWR